MTERTASRPTAGFIVLHTPDVNSFAAVIDVLDPSAGSCPPARAPAAIP